LRGALLAFAGWSFALSGSELGAIGDISPIPFHLHTEED
jgi:hypothetical protein